MHGIHSQWDLPLIAMILVSKILGIGILSIRSFSVQQFWFATAGALEDYQIIFAAPVDK